MNNEAIKNMNGEIITYEEVLDQLQDKKAHLLLGNGFNLSLGIKTDYKSIFEKMSENYSQYVDLNVKKNQFDIEKVIGKLKEQIKETDDVFLSKFIHNKIKLDFMKATSEIVASETKKIFQPKKQKALHLLLKNFTNYFTLNYDPLLYILLMRFKNNNDALVFRNKHKVKTEELNEETKGIYVAIKEARQNGTLTIKSGDNQTKYNLENLNKGDFESLVIKFFKDKDWNKECIKLAVTYFLQEESVIKSGIKGDLNVNDGFRNSTYVEKTSLLKQEALFPDDTKKDSEFTSQNLFFLHGAFHIYKKAGHLIKKIEQEENTPLYKKLEKTIYEEDKEMICVFSNDEKKEQIQDDSYLKIGYKKLSQLSGVIVVIGSSFDDNDSHIFSQIKKSRIDQIYVACDPSSKKIDSFCDKVKKRLGDKKIIFFDWNTLSHISQ